jgi:acyl-CoA reductase-like NAD-dependent aldehyde dehydrogenase
MPGPPDSSTPVLSVASPLDGSPLPTVAATPLDDTPRIVQAAREAQQAWAARDLASRVRSVAKLKRALLRRAGELASRVRAETGKPLEEALLAEVLSAADLVDYWTGSIEALLEPAAVEPDPLLFPGKKGLVRRLPRGVIALVTPWNYPFVIPMRTLVPALLAGNAVVLKPSEVTPRTGAALASLFEGILPPGLLGLVQGGGEAARRLIDAGVDAVCFTGGVATGRLVAAACAEHLVPCSLELGGKDAAIVLADAHLERAARGIVWAAFTNAGQNCASVERVYVERAVAARFAERVVALTRALSAERDVSVMTTRRQRDLVASHVREALERGAELLAGGVPEGDSLAFPPTVLRVADESCALMRDETFGPVLPIVVVDGAEDAIERANATRFGLTVSLWTRRIGRARKLAARLRAGVVTVNNHAFTAALPMAPWTGVKESGWGVTNGPHALESLTRPCLVLEDRSRAKRELWWYPYTDTLKRAALAMARVRGGAGLFGRVAALLALLVLLPRRLLERERRAPL